MASINLTNELADALRASGPALGEIVRDALRTELERFMGAGADELLDATQAGPLLGMSPAALRRAEERGRSPVRAVRLGRRLRWRRGDVLALARAR
jgi:hypothetical protein